MFERAKAARSWEYMKEKEQLIYIHFIKQHPNVTYDEFEAHMAQHGEPLLTLTREGARIAREAIGMEAE